MRRCAGYTVTGTMPLPNGARREGSLLSPKEVLAAQEQAAQEQAANGEVTPAALGEVEHKNMALVTKRQIYGRRDSGS